MAGLAPQSCIEDLGSLILTQSADALWKMSSKRRRAWLVISKGKSQTETCMVPLKAHCTPLFCHLICVPPGTQQKPFVGMETERSRYLGTQGQQAADPARHTAFPATIR